MSDTIENEKAIENISLSVPFTTEVISDLSRLDEALKSNDVVRGIVLEEEKDKPKKREKKSIGEKKEEEGQSKDISKILQAIAKIRKEQGEDVIIDGSLMSKIPRVPLSSPIIGDMMGFGGCPSRIIELFGHESSGKSLLATQIGADFQKAGKFVVYIDLESSFSFEFAKQMGLNTDPSIFCLLSPTTGEDAFTLIQEFAETKQVGLIILDSLAGISANAEQEAGFDEAQMAVNARLISKGFRKIGGLLSKSKTTLLLINQMRKSLSAYTPEVTSGGESTKYWASIRIRVNKKEIISKSGQEEDAIGISSTCFCAKNKTSKPFKKYQVDFYFDRGMDIPAQYFDLAVTKEVITKGGAWFSYGEEKWQGRENAIKALKENETIYLSIKEKVDTLLKAN